MTSYDGALCLLIWRIHFCSQRRFLLPEILDDESIDCIVEAMGGITDAKDVVFEAITVSLRTVVLIFFVEWVGCH